MIGFKCFDPIKPRFGSIKHGRFIQLDLPLPDFSRQECHTMMMKYHTMMMKFESLGDLPLGPGNNCGNRKKRIALE